MRHLFHLLLVLSCLARSASAQEAGPSGEPYASFSLRAARLVPVGIGALAPYYDAIAGGLLEAETPFQAGTLGVTFGWMSLRQTSTVASGTASRAVLREPLPAQIIGINWRFPAYSRGRLHVAAGVRASTFRLRLSDSSISRNDRTEDELTLGITAQAGLAVSRGFSLVASGDVSRVWANIPWHLRTISLGVSWKHAMPTRVREWLR